MKIQAFDDSGKELLIFQWKDEDSNKDWPYDWPHIFEHLGRVIRFYRDNPHIKCEYGHWQWYNK